MMQGFFVVVVALVVQHFILYWSIMSLVAQWKTINLPMQQTWVWSLSWEDALEKKLAIRSSIPAWEIPWTEPGGPHNPTSHISIRYYLVTKTTNNWWIMLSGSSPSRIQGYPQDDGLGGRISKQRAGLDLPWLTQKSNKAPVFQGVILKEEPREKRREKEKKNGTGRPSFGERGP